MPGQPQPGGVHKHARLEQCTPQHSTENTKNTTQRTDSLQRTAKFSRHCLFRGHHHYHNNAATCTRVHTRSVPPTNRIGLNIHHAKFKARLMHPSITPSCTPCQPTPAPGDAHESGCTPAQPHPPAKECTNPSPSPLHPVPRPVPCLLHPTNLT